MLNFSLSHIPAELHEHAQLCHQQFQEQVKNHAVSIEFTDKQYQQIMKVLCCSDFVRQVIKKQTEWFLISLNTHLFDKPRSLIDLQHKISKLFKTSQNLSDLSEQLRIFRNQEMLHIAWRDIIGYADLNETMSQLSLLADISIKSSLKWLHNNLKQDFGMPIDSHGDEMQMIVLAMGKLGANELNFSSDIDLIFVFPEHGKTINGRRSISSNEFFIKLGQKLIKLLNDTTAYGFVFRVDMRLRPFGKSGPLAVSIGAMEDYYAEHGREWERYALIKARLITGNTVDKQKLQQLLKPFIYRRYIDFSVFESLREMKQMISHEVKQKRLQYNIKLGAGGIREIEFLAQAFQLLRGGRDKELQQQSVQLIISLLSKKHIIPEDVAGKLLSAYIFLRNTEHRIQEFNDQQIHLLPVSHFDRFRLAYGMGFLCWENFYEQLTSHQKEVQDAFAQQFQLPHSNSQQLDSQQQYLCILWCDTLNQIDCHEPIGINKQINPYEADKLIANKAIAYDLLKQSGFKQTEDILQLLLAFRQSFQYRKMSTNARDRLNHLMPVLLSYLASKLGNEQIESKQSYLPSSDVNPTIIQNTILKRLLTVIESICRRSVYLVLLTENPQALSQLIKLCSASVWITRELSRTPALLDELLDPQILYSPLKQEDLSLDLQSRLKNSNPLDLEQQMEILRHFKLIHVLRVACADISGVIAVTKVSDYLSWIAETILQQVIHIAWLNTAEKMPKPHNNTVGDGFAVIGFGKMGGIELGYSSDLDLVFVYHDRYKKHAHFFTRLSQRIMLILATRSYSGILYECDLRLRPNGNSGQIATTFRAFKKYQLEKAWLWEHQALCRARIVAGDQNLLCEFSQIRREVLCQPREKQHLQSQINDMRDKMYQSLAIKQADIFDVKQSYGGIVDIEFIVQYLILYYANNYPQILDYSDNIRIIESLIKFKLIAPEVGKNLSQIYQKYRNFIHHQALQELSSITSINIFTNEQKIIKSYWHKFIEDNRAM
jgi:[glutamine synthetase] adenylyltransferase / [glutamine synthetase]-adenylyl-L-tyrosine phosphorylase